MENLHVIILAVVFVAFAVFWISAVVSIVRSELATPVVKALWIIVAFVFPLVGPIVWFIASRYQRRQLVSGAGSAGSGVSGPSTGV